MGFKTLKDFDLQGQVVLMRADLNVPRMDGKVTDTTRIDRLKPSIDFLTQHGAKVLILSHFGRPEGGQHDPQMSLAFLVPVLQERWGTNVSFAADCIGEAAHSLAQNLKNGEVGLLENVRFYKEEKKNDPDFAKKLSEPGDIYVNDAFSVSHRAHASTEGITKYLPSAAGLLMEAELTALDQALGHPQKPVMAITGGSKISTKLSVLHNLIEKVDYLVLGGGMANTFLYAQGANIGSSLCEEEMADEARQIMDKAKSLNCEIILPSDCVCVSDIKPHADHDILDPQNIPAGKRAIDVGPKSVTSIKQAMDQCKTIVWNGPMGVFEIPPFDHGTNALAQYVAEKTAQGSLVSIAGGGDTVAALENAKSKSHFSYVSTAGGAFLEWLEGKDLPGVSALGK